MRKYAMSALAVLILIGASGSALAQSSQPTSERKPAAATYKLEFVLTEFENGKKVNSRNYSMMTQEDHRGQFRVGSHVPITTSSLAQSNPSATPITQVQYMDVGVNIDCRLMGSEDNLSLDGTVEVSGISLPPQGSPGPGQPVIRQSKTSFGAGVPSGKPGPRLLRPGISGFGGIPVPFARVSR